MENESRLFSLNWFYPNESVVFNIHTCEAEFSIVFLLKYLEAVEEKHEGVESVTGWTWPFDENNGSLNLLCWGEKHTIEFLKLEGLSL